MEVVSASRMENACPLQYKRIKVEVTDVTQGNILTSLTFPATFSHYAIHKYFPFFFLT